MANNRYKFYNYNSPYKDNDAIRNARSNLVALSNNAPVYSNSYADQLEGIYNKIRGRQAFDYNPENDATYRQYADQYRALVGLAVAGNQAQAQDLTGGYGSTYAPEVARQGLARLNTGVEMAQPAFLQLGQAAYDVNGDTLYNMYGAGADRRADELAAFNKDADVWNYRLGNAANEFDKLSDIGYERKSFNRNRQYSLAGIKADANQNKIDMKLAKYDTYNQLAGNKCADYNAKGDNKGMKAYLQGLVKAGKLTQYMADNLYKQYEYTPPKRSGGGGGRRRSSGGGSGSGEGKKGTITILGGSQNQVIGTYESDDGKDYVIPAGIIRDISMRGDKGATANGHTSQTRVDYIQSLDLSDAEKLALLRYYGIIGE